MSLRSVSSNDSPDGKDTTAGVSWAKVSPLQVLAFESSPGLVALKMATEWPGLPLDLAQYLDVAEDGTITRFDEKAAFLLAQHLTRPGLAHAAGFRVAGSLLVLALFMLGTGIARN